MKRPVLQISIFHGIVRIESLMGLDGTYEHIFAKILGVNITFLQKNYGYEHYIFALKSEIDEHWVYPKIALLRTVFLPK